MDSYALPIAPPDDLYNGMTVLYGDLLAPAGPGLLPVNSTFGMPEHFARPEWLARSEAGHHPHRLTYLAPAAFRAAAHALTHPGYTLTGFAALALYGLPVLVEGRDTTLAGPGVARKRPATVYTPALSRAGSWSGETWQVFCRGRLVRIAAPAVAVAQALRAIRRGEVGWPVERTVHDPAFVRAVQLIDACRFFLRIPPASVKAAARSRVDDEWVGRVLRASSALAESPKETEMRLIAAVVAKELGLELQEQVPVFRGDRLVTVLDAALPEALIAYMYDGVHHWGKQQRVKDARITTELIVLGWAPLRFAEGFLHTLPSETRELVDRPALQDSGKRRRKRPKAS